MPGQGKSCKKQIYPSRLVFWPPTRKSFWSKNSSCQEMNTWGTSRYGRLQNIETWSSLYEKVSTHDEYILVYCVHIKIIYVCICNYIRTTGLMTSTIFKLTTEIWIQRMVLEKQVSLAESTSSEIIHQPHLGHNTWATKKPYLPFYYIILVVQYGPFWWQTITPT